MRNHGTTSLSKWGHRSARSFGGRPPSSGQRGQDKERTILYGGLVESTAASVSFDVPTSTSSSSLPSKSYGVDAQRHMVTASGAPPTYQSTEQ